jgi:hypothetical protein
MLDNSILAESRCDLRHAAELMGTAEKPAHLSKVIRAIIKGIKTPTGERVRLDALRVGGRWITSTEAISRFASELTASRLGTRELRPKVTPTDHRARRLAQVERELDARGIKG